ncbi:vWA domain-containing protein [Cuneatibacter caecimuris]|uniref:VWFA domain-containing protein n=1 Tax=Cuneatibacter caecimuris TaxID=1796618 RepID=A0A4Q7PQ03_9FIRM|nr:hypothetical protein [Cuneatibacter caecimuris]RZT03032.1 hypothetical protein EV209_1165 [Cuneatibacter caecimuris]
MNKTEEEVLKSFHSEYNRNIEESFVEMLTERDEVRLFFINEDRAFTDGRNIVVDPADREIFCDSKAIYDTETWMGIPHRISQDNWMALHMVTRAQSIHEALHIIYTRFPLYCLADKRATSKIRLTALSMISNIIEDGYIEAAGCSEYDNLELYLLFGRISSIFASAPFEGTVSQVFGGMEKAEAGDDQLLRKYLEHMGGFLLYPMLQQEEPGEEIKEYVENTRQLFLEGSACGDPEKRYEFTDQIFDCIESIIPKADTRLDTSVLEKMLGGRLTHDSMQASALPIKNTPRNGTVSRRLTVDLTGKELPKRNFKDQIDGIFCAAANDRKAAMAVLQNQGSKRAIMGAEYDCAELHKGIQIIEQKPAINLNLKRAYQNVFHKYQININAYNQKFHQLLKTPISVQATKKLYGSGVDSRRMGDIKKRYWYCNTVVEDAPDLAIMLLIDGSGSMEGARVEGARAAAVVLHEVMKKQGIEHAIVEHRAIYGKPEVFHNILINFHAREEEKYNILSLTADEGTREGLSLYWAEAYLQKNAMAEHKLILVLSDGVPAHGIHGPGCYLPPVSTKDTANAVKKICRRGTGIIAIALDDSGYSCYHALKEIYPYVIACTDLKKLTGQLLGVIMKQYI